MYPLLATSVEVEDDEEETEPTAVATEATKSTPIATEATESTPIATEATESTPVATEDKTISEKEMDDQFLHLCIRVCFVR